MRETTSKLRPLVAFIVILLLIWMLRAAESVLTPLMVFYSLVFWGWVWGVPGALLGVPLTMGIVVTCQHFESTRWVARLLLNH